MNRTPLLKTLFLSISTECFQQRSYAIMSRAKHRAGLPVAPVTSTSTKAPKKATSRNAKAAKDALKWRTTGYFNKQHEHADEKTTRALLKNRLENLNFRKPADISERLIKVQPQSEIVQPENPHLLKVAVIGAANAGKSTLINKIVGEEVTGVSPKAHTTRERILAVYSHGNYQIVFLDTPGVIPDHNHAKMNRTLATTSWRSLDEADHVMIVVDAGRSIQPQSRAAKDFILDRIKDLKIPATLVFNKMDLLHEDRSLLEQVAEEYTNGYPRFKKTLYISAVYEEGIEKVKDVLCEQSPKKKWLYPADQKTETPTLKRVEELIRVQFFKRLHQYIPYMLKLENVGWTEMKDGTLRIDQNVYVERDSQQKIVIGFQGRIINSVVEEATKQISKALKRPVKLFIQIKTRKPNV
ncbi:P-loop containing nucleoside triphosphate hydrolase protein [Parasitella parasitica]|nr:P-loop containing nucleoside triphosphate hydrolase protein [Parasitella parasitica]